MLVRTAEHKTTSNFIEETVSTYNIFKWRIFEEVNKLWLKKTTGIQVIRSDVRYDVGGGQGRGSSGEKGVREVTKRLKEGKREKFEG